MPLNAICWRDWRAAVAAFLHTGGCRGAEWQRLPEFAPAAAICVCCGVYGAVMASFAGFGADRLLMVVYGALKVPMLFFVTMLLAVPCFYVVNMLLGVGHDFSEVWRALIDYQLSVALQLAALAPVTAFMNVSNGNYGTVLAWSTLLFGCTAWNARRSMIARYRILEQKSPVHRSLRRFWFILYAFVGVQMAWDLRPFVGSPAMPVQFFRDEIGNAYVEIARLGVLFLKAATGWS